MCHMGFNCQWNSARLPVVFRSQLLGLAWSLETIWDPGGVGAVWPLVCYACLRLIALSRCILMYDLRWSCLPNLFLKDICCERIMERELVSLGSFIPPCYVSFSSHLDVSRIKRLWTDTIVGWDINAPLWLCVGV